MKKADQPQSETPRRREFQDSLWISDGNHFLAAVRQPIISRLKPPRVCSVGQAPWARLGKCL